MFFLARKNLLEQPVRLLISVGGVALAVMLVVVMSAILQGVIREAGALIKNTDAQVWVVQEGFTDIAHGFSVLSPDLEDRLAAIPGVRDVNPLLGARTEVPVEDGKEQIAVIGYDTGTGVGGPWRFAGDAAVPGPGEIVVDETFAKTGGLEVGDVLELPDRPRRIVALSAGTNQFVNQLAFAALEDVRGLVRLRRDVNFYALRTTEPATERVIAQIAREIPGVTPFSKARFTENNQAEIEEGFQPILYAMVAIAFLVGLAIVGLTIYTATMEKTREYGVISAIGARTRRLAGIVVRQALLTVALGFVAGCILAFPAGRLIKAMAPKTELVYPLTLYPAVALAAALMALLASYLPVRRLARLDPAMVFRA